MADGFKIDSLWLFDRSEGYDKDFYGAFIPQVAYQLLSRYTQEKDLVIDWFVGSGTSAHKAVELNRQLIGIDIDESRVVGLQKKFEPNKDIFFFCGNSTDHQIVFTIKKKCYSLFGKDDPDFSILHPPYYDIIKFTQGKGDLSSCSSLDLFLSQFAQVARNCYSVLKKKGFVALVIGDIYKNSQLYPLGFYCMQTMMSQGFMLKSIIVKNIANNERGKGKNLGLWKYRAIKGNFSLFSHEYIMVFQK